MPAEHARIQILRLTQHAADIAQIRDLLSKEDINADLTHVTRRDEFESVLSHGNFDVILIDHAVPGHDAVEAVRFAKDLDPTIPIIVVSGSTDHKRAAPCLEQGATHYLSDNHLDLLGAVLRGALRESADKRNHRDAEVALRERERRFRQLAEKIEDVFWVATPDCQTALYTSPAFERIWGRSLTDLHANPKLWIECIHPDDQPHVRASLERLAAGVNYEIEYRIVLPNGHFRWILDRGFALRDTAGHVYRTIGVARDITDRKFTEEFRQQSEERLASIFGGSPIAIAFGSADGRLIDVNPEFCKFLGCVRDEVVGRSLSDFWAEPKTRDRAIATLSAKKMLRNYAAEFRRKSGTLRSGLVSMEMLRLGDKAMLLTMIMDVTDQKQLEAQLHRAQRLESVGQLASGIAHDMNNILAPIMMSAPLLRMGVPAAEADKILSTIEVSAQRGAALVRQLLNFGRGVEGDRRPVNLAGILAEVAKFCRQTLPRNITINCDAADDVWSVHGDATQLHQVAMNLCVNARDAMPSGGRLTLSAENTEIDEYYSALYPDAKPGQYVLLRVTDTGEGISPENMDRIFDPFFTTKEATKGTGLGLSTVLGIVKSHEGFVRLHSEPGKGTRFEIYLSASSNRASAPPFETAAKAPSGNGELIMVVDDEEPIRTMLRDTLLQSNYRVLTARDGVEATVAFVANPDVRLVLTDLDMPLIGGITLARVLRHLEPSVKCVISTGLDGRSGAGKHRKELDALGISAVLTKPYTAKNLLRVIKTVLG